MTLPELSALVREMREAQRKYFKTRQRDDLVASKMLESKVDAALAAMKEEKS